MTQQLTDDQVRHVAKLSRLQLTDEQIHHFAGQLSAVLDYISKLNELDVSQVEPMAHAVDLTDVLRHDEPGQPLSVEAVLANSPAAHPPFFKVPKVLGDSSGA